METSIDCIPKISGNLHFKKAEKNALGSHLPMDFHWFPTRKKRLCGYHWPHSQCVAPGHAWPRTTAGSQLPSTGCRLSAPLGRLARSSGAGSDKVSLQLQHQNSGSFMTVGDVHPFLGSQISFGVIKHGVLEYPRTEWRFLAKKITYFYGLFSSTPCVITRG